MRSISPLAPIFLILGLSTFSLAARFHLSDGRVLEASYVGEADGEVTVLTVKGRSEALDKSSIQWVDWNHRLSDSLESKAKRKRTAFFKRRAAAKKLLLALESAPAEERSKHESELEGFQEHELLAAMDRGLRSKRLHVREYSMRRLAGFESPAVVVPLVHNALASPDREFAKKSHTLALAKNADKAREVYEYVTVTGDVERRLLALDAVREIGDRKSVPRLVRGLSYVHSHIRAQVARSKGIREIPIRLSGSDVTIELPELEILEVMTTVQIAVPSLRRIRSRTVTTLESITGESFGDDVAAWNRWWIEQERARTVPEPESRQPRSPEACSPGGNSHGATVRSR